jgi:hypothetical protein
MQAEEILASARAQAGRLVAHAENAIPFEDALCCSGWWNCPRSGVAVVAGEPYFFDCQFFEEWPAAAMETGML